MAAATTAGDGKTLPSKSAIFDRLPFEVLALIVQEAQRKDISWRKKKGYGYYGSHGRARKTITPAKCRSFEFRLGKLPPSLLQPISHLSLTSGEPNQLVDVRLALPMLSSLTKVTISSDVFPSSGDSYISTLPPKAPSGDAVLEALAGAITHTPHVALQMARSTSTNDKLFRLVPKNVHRLEVHDYEYGVKPAKSDAPNHDMAALANLEALTVGNSPAFAASLLENLHKVGIAAPHLKSLDISVRHAQQLSTIARVAPSLVDVRLDARRDVADASAEFTGSQTAFEHVNTLSFCGKRQTTPLLSFFHASPLQHLRIELLPPGTPSQQQPDLSSIDDSIALPHSIETIQLVEADILPLEDYVTFAKRMRDVGIVNRTEGRLSINDDVDQLADELLRILEWAQSRAEWAGQIGDDAAIKELEWALKEVDDIKELAEL
ncbi:hypothetical protein JCM10296v2_004660 [Rhodotorula toruloides]